MISRGYRSTSGKRLAGTALVLTCGALPGCGGSDQPSERPFEPRERIIREVEWSEEFAIKGSLQDTLLLGPGRLAARTRAGSRSSITRGRLVDTYDLDTGEYIESLRVPGGAYQISYGGGMLYLAYADPYPSLIGLRPTEGRLP